jgi:hypothetical protein
MTAFAYIDEHALRAWAGGFLEGVRTPCGARQPMR